MQIYTKNGIINDEKRKKKSFLDWVLKGGLKKVSFRGTRRGRLCFVFCPTGRKTSPFKTSKGFLSANVIEIIENFNTDTYRVVYTVRFKNLVYILHAFQKKSTSGIKTRKRDINLINSRLKMAEAHFKLISLEMKDE